MLIAAVRTGHALAGKAVTYDDDDGKFRLTGVGEISPARLIDYDDQRQLHWADTVTREWALEMAAILVRKQTAEDQKQAAAAAEAAAEAARLEALAPPSVVYPPPDTRPPRPEGIPAIAPGFDLSPEALDRPPRWVVWSEASGDPGSAAGPSAAGATAPDTPAPPEPANASSSTPPASTGVPPLAPSPAGAPATPEQPPPSGTPDGQVVPAAGRSLAPTPRRERRKAKRELRRRGERAGARLRIGLYVLAAAVAAAILYLVQRGGL